MDKIKIRNLEIFAKHGVLKEETILGQKFLISVDLFLDTTLATTKDDITLSINYAEVCYFIKQFMEEHTYQLIETAAETLARAILIHYSLVEAIILELKKPWAPIQLSLETVAIEIERNWHTAYLGNKTVKNK